MQIGSATPPVQVISAGPTLSEGFVTVPQMTDKEKDIMGMVSALQNNTQQEANKLFALHHHVSQEGTPLYNGMEINNVEDYVKMLAARASDSEGGYDHMGVSARQYASLIDVWV